MKLFGISPTIFGEGKDRQAQWVLPNDFIVLAWVFEHERSDYVWFQCDSRGEKVPMSVPERIFSDDDALSVQFERLVRQELHRRREQAAATLNSLAPIEMTVLGVPLSRTENSRCLVGGDEQGWTVCIYPSAEEPNWPWRRQKISVTFRHRDESAILPCEACVDVAIEAEMDNVEKAARAMLDGLARAIQERLKVDEKKDTL